MELLSDLKDLWNVGEIRSKALNVTTIEAHARFDEVKIELFSLTALNMLLFAISVTEFGQATSKCLIHL